MPHRSSVPVPWRLKKHKYSLAGSVCDCGRMHFPPRSLCTCGLETKPAVFSGRGTIISYTTVHVAPAGFENPYNMALVKLDEGPVISGLVVDGPLEIGKRVKTVFRRLQTDGKEGLISYGFKFELVD